MKCFARHTWLLCKPARHAVQLTCMNWQPLFAWRWFWWHESDLSQDTPGRDDPADETGHSQIVESADDRIWRKGVEFSAGWAWWLRGWKPALPFNLACVAILSADIWPLLSLPKLVKSATDGSDMLIEKEAVILSYEAEKTDRVIN